MSTYKAQDACTDLILDFIAGGVPGNRYGESGGNYNAVIGNAKATASLATHTIADIYSLQAQLLRSGKPSSAVGRYQIVHATLVSLVDGPIPEVKHDTLFMPAIQDRLAVALLVRRGYQKWWKEALDDEQFAHNLSCEWASLPDPQNGGRSHYDGIGPNHAGTTLAAVYAMLTQAGRSKK